MKKRIATIVTEYRENSHADVIVGKLLEGYSLDGVWTEPRVEVVSMYTDQVPKNDMSRDMCAKHGVPIFDTIAGALTLGGSSLAVDGVVIVGEHGDYPLNEWGQKLYPRRRLFEETVKVFRESGRVVPVFTDKHLSYSWENAKWMYDTARELKIPFMAGSSLPVTWRRPPLEIPLGAQVTEALGIGYGGLDAYGFHALEMLQCMVERRAGGESGVAAVRTISGTEFWQAAEAGVWPRDLFEAAWSRSERKSAEALESSCKDPAAYLVEYRDGLKATILMLEGATQQFSFAARVDGQVQSTLFYLQSGKPFGHFAFLTNKIEDLLLTGQPPYPVERTLLTTGILARALESHYLKGEQLATSELAVAY